MRVVIFLLALVAGALGHMHLVPQAKAWIDPADSNGAMGYVVVQGGIVKTMLNLTNFDYVAAGLVAGDCNPTNSANGISYHIHAKYTSTTTNSSAGGGCDSAATGGHFDPWYACGQFTDQTTACLPGCVKTRRPIYNCTNANFLANPFSCEVGDWSAKYGNLMESSPGSNVFMSTTTANRFEITSAELYNPLMRRSVVFHCNGKRALCAPFKADPTMMKPPGFNVTGGLAAATAAGTRMVADFGSLNRGPAIVFGGGELQMDGPSVAKLLARYVVGGGCPGAKIIAQINAGMWTNSMDAIASTTGGCSPQALGGVLDPGVRCVPGSSMSFTTNRTLMPELCSYNTTTMENLRCPILPALGGQAIPVNYSAASLMMSSYNAAQGTIVLPSLTGSVVTTGATLPAQYLDERKLLGKSVSILCVDNPMKGWCAKIQAMPQGYTYAGRTGSPTRLPTKAPIPGATVTPTAAPVAVTKGTNGVGKMNVAVVFGIVAAAALVNAEW